MPSPTPSQRKKQLAATRARRAKTQERREGMLEDLATGVQHSVIARKNNISLRTVRREIGRALDKCWSETPQRHLRLQVERLNLALRAIDDALLVGDLSAVEPLLKVTENSTATTLWLTASPPSSRRRFRGSRSAIADRISRLAPWNCPPSTCPRRRARTDAKQRGLRPGAPRSR